MLIKKLLNNKYHLIALALGIVTLLAFSVRLVQLKNMADESAEQRKQRREAVCTEAEWFKERARCEKNSRTEAHRLFDDLLAQPGLVNVEKDGQLTLPPSDYLLKLEYDNQPIPDKPRSLMKRLYASPAGKSVQQQVAWWNHSRRFAAIRDDNPQMTDTESGWQAYDHWDSVLPGWGIVPLDYGYVNNGVIPQFFNDWLSVSGKEAKLFRRELKVAKAQTLNIQVIGEPDISQLPKGTRLQACYSGSKVKKSFCKTVNDTVSDASVYRIQVLLRPNKHYKLILPVKPAQNNERLVDGLPIHIKPITKPNKPEPVEQAQAYYQPSDYAWTPIFDFKRDVVANAQDAFNFQLKTADGRLLFDSLKKYPSDFTRDYGLLSLVGYDVSDRLALAGLIARSKLEKNNTEIRLTLDSSLQQLAHKHLQQELKIIDPKQRYKDIRRAAVVILKPESGAILAAANYPNPPDNVSRWDRLSYAKLYPTKDPFGVPAWQGLDNNNTPGSTFKLVTGMAALQEAEKGNETLRTLIRGVGEKEYRELTGLSVNSSNYDPDGDSNKATSIASTIGNSSNHTLARAFMPYKTKAGMVYPPLRLSGKNGCSSKAVTSRNLGMREGVRSSLNTWFARLGVMMDGERLATGGKDTHLVEMATRLGFGEKLALAQIGSPLNKTGKLTHHKGRGSVLTGFTGSLSLESRSKGQYATGDALQRLAQNSFGQGVSATPLQMARIASTVATNQLPSPYILQSWASEPLNKTEGSAIVLEDINLLREGMKAVPEVGTAKAAFRTYYPKGACDVYGKTGTAQVASGTGKGAAQHPYYSAWFVGWREVEGSQPDLAFACMVTHTLKSHEGHNYGGDVCGAIVARILADQAKAKLGVKP